MATKETAKKDVKETTKKNEVKEMKEIKKETTKVPPKETTKKNEVKEIKKEVPKKETPKKNENVSKTENISKKTIKNVEAKEIKKVEKETTKEKSFEKRPSAGKQIRTLFELGIPKLKKEHLEILTSAEKTKEVLKIRYSFLKESTDNKEDRKINGHCRYGKNTIKINNKDYWMTNDLYQRNIETFKAWVDSLK